MKSDYRVDWIEEWNGSAGLYIISWVNKGGMSSCGMNSELIAAHTLKS